MKPEPKEQAPELTDGIIIAGDGTWTKERYEERIAYLQARRTRKQPIREVVTIAPLPRR